MRAGAAAALELAGSTAIAEKSTGLDRASVGLGGYDARADTTLGASSSTAEYAGDFSLEKDLGFTQHNSMSRARLHFLLGDGYGFSLDYDSANRQNSESLSRGIGYNGNDCSAAGSVRGRLNFDFGSAACRWWLGQGNDAFGLGPGGANYAPVRASVAKPVAMAPRSAKTHPAAVTVRGHRSCSGAGGMPSTTSGGCRSTPLETRSVTGALTAAASMRRWP